MIFISTHVVHVVAFIAWSTWVAVEGPVHFSANDMFIFPQ